MSIPPRSRGETRIRSKRSFVSRKLLLPSQIYIHNEVISGATLLVATLAALIWANSPWQATYFQMLNTKISLDIFGLTIAETFKHWINDGAMVLFFFVVGLEIKREFVYGKLSNKSQAALPFIAALGGMVLPALIFYSFNMNGAIEESRGWGIPIATDIAFALGILALLGDRIPSEVRVFLLALATIDDIGAILVIAGFYTNTIAWVMLGAAALLFLLMGIMRWIGFRNIMSFIIVGLLFWFALLKSGIHPTVAGVMVGLLTPTYPWFDPDGFANSADRCLFQYRRAIKEEDTDTAQALLGQFEELTLGTESLGERLERLVHPWVAFCVLPLFALANAGVPLSAVKLQEALVSNVSLGVGGGLILGKFFGIVGFCWIAINFGFVKMPEKITWPHLYGVGFLSGIGFTVSLFITGLAYSDDLLVQYAKYGVLIASCVTGLAGYVFLLITSKRSIKPAH